MTQIGKKGTAVGGASGMWWALAWLGLAFAAWVARSQISSIVAQVTPTGQYSVASLLGPGQLGSLATAPYVTLSAWDQAGVLFGGLREWLWWYLAFDLIFIVAFTMLGLTFLRGRRRASVARGLLLGVAAAYLSEAIVGAFTLMSAHPRVNGTGVNGFAEWVLHIVTEVKWVMVIIALAWSAYRVHASYRAYLSSEEATLDKRRGIYADIRRLAHALEVQRFSLVVVLLLGLAAVGPPVNGILEQMPDVQRAWLNTTGSLAGLGQMLIAATAQALLALMLFLLGRMRTLRAGAKFASPEHDGTNYHDGRNFGARLSTWLVLPLVALALAAGLGLSGLARVSWPRVLAFIGVLLLIAAASKALDLLRHEKSTAQPRQVESMSWQLGASPLTLGRPLPGREEKVVSVTAATGNALAVAVVAVTAIGAVRSFTVPALVIGGRVPRIAEVVGIAGSFILPLLPVCRRELGTLARRFRVRLPGQAQAADADRTDAARPEPQPEPQPEPELQPEPEPQPAPPGDRGGRRAARQRQRSERRADSRRLAGNTWPLLVAAVPFILADIRLVLAPLEATHVLGVLGTAVIAIGSFATLLGALAYLAQTRRPLLIFRALRMNVTPMMSIVLVIAIAGGIADQNSALHDVQGPAAQGTVGRHTLTDDLATWLSAVPGSCAFSVPGTAPAGGHLIQVVPLIQVAASGGGIRAAWWAVHVLGSIASRPCGARDVFAVSSVSGGSVGAAVLAAADAADPVPAADATITTMASPDALAAVIDGLMLRDAIAGYTGIEFPAAQLQGNDHPPDRAALMEAVWQREDPALRTPFLQLHGAFPWVLLANSTSVSTGCRAILSTAALPRSSPATSAAQGLPCDLGTAGPAGGYDFFARLRCMQKIATSTAAMISARFPYITPTGTVNGCGSQRGTFNDQLVDGGYGDASGLSTLVDLAPTVMSLVRAHNEQVIAGAHAGQPITLVVPVTVYLGNSVQPAQMATTPTRTPEFYAPPRANSIGPVTELSGINALLQNMAAITGPTQWVTCATGDRLCADAVRKAQGLVPNQLIMVAPREFPDVAAPLGWLMSQASQRALYQALGRDIRDKPCGKYQESYAQGRPYCLPGIGGIADLLALVKAGG